MIRRITKWRNMVRYGRPTPPPYRPPLPEPLTITRHRRPVPADPHRIARVSPLTGWAGPWWTGKDRDQWTHTLTNAAVFETRLDAEKALRESLLDVFYPDAQAVPTNGRAVPHPANEGDTTSVRGG